MVTTKNSNNYMKSYFSFCHPGPACTEHSRGDPGSTISAYAMDPDPDKIGTG